MSFLCQQRLARRHKLNPPRFHTYDYARHFLSSCTRILGLETEPNGIDFEGRFAQVGTFPIGIDPYAFVEAVKKPHVEQRTRSLEAKFDGKKVIIGVDRLDYIKGIPQKLQSFEIFLSQHPSWVEKCVLVQLAIPSRQDVEEYQNLRACVNELVGKINGRFGTVDHTPIHYLHRSVPFEELCSMYAMSDACLITSTRDGMNLVRMIPQMALGNADYGLGGLRVHLEPKRKAWIAYSV